jgi:hypothetical protein
MMPKSILITSETPQMKKKSIVSKIIPPMDRYVGVVIESPYNKHVTTLVKAIYVNSRNASATNLVIVDLHTAELLHTYPIDLRVGLNTIPIDKEFISQVQGGLFFVGIDQSNVTLAELDCGTYYSPCDCRCPDIIDDFTPTEFSKCGNFSIEKGIKNLKLTGVCVDAQIRCNLNLLICEYKDILVHSYVYQEAICYIEEGLVTSNRSWYTENMDIYKIQNITLPMLKENLMIAIKQDAKALRPVLDSSVI